MVRFARKPEDLISCLPEVKKFLAASPAIIFAYLFGSLAKERATPLSDVDIAVYLRESADTLREREEILGNLIEIFRTDEIDLVILNTAPLPLTARIIANKKLLADKEPFLRHKFESLRLREYFDFSVREMQIFTQRYSIGR